VRTEFQPRPLRIARTIAAVGALLWALAPAVARAADDGAARATGVRETARVVTDASGSRLQVGGRDFLVRGMNWDYVPIGQNYAFDLFAQPEPVIRAALALKPLAGAVLASILLAGSRANEALEVAREAMRWPESGGRIEEGESLLRLTLVRALFANGHAEEARAALAVARARIMERAATIRRPDLRQKYLASVPEHATTLELAAASLS